VSTQTGEGIIGVLVGCVDSLVSSNLVVGFPGGVS
jgi:hypothetical protein